MCSLLEILNIFSLMIFRFLDFVFSLLSTELTKRIPLRMHANSMDSSKETTLLSQDVAVSLLQENKMALKRCELVRVMKSLYSFILFFFCSYSHDSGVLKKSPSMYDI